MRRVTAILSVTAIVLMAAGLFAQAKPSFAGEWKRDVPIGQGEPGVDLIITQSATSMTVEYPKSPTALKFTYMLDGSASKNTMARRDGGAPTDLVSKAVWAGNKLVVTTTTGASGEKRTFSMEGDNLVLETAAPNGIIKTTYKRYERGFGG
jgi:hypothetical protein